MTSWSVTLAERGKYQSVSARNRDLEVAEDIVVATGEEEPRFEVHRVYKDEVEATKAAQAKLSSFQRGKSTLTLETIGDPGMIAEAKLNLSGFREGVNGAWVIESVTHKLGCDGYTITVVASVAS